jgi:hypothetical protein
MTDDPLRNRSPLVIIKRALAARPLAPVIVDRTK